MTTMSQADYARRHGVSRKTATMWKKDGLIVLTEEGVDVEASDERLRMYRNQHDGRAQRGAAKPGRGGVTQVARAQGNGRTSAKVTAGRVTLTLGEIEQRLRALDWTKQFDWSPEAQERRARQAAECLGWQAVTSDLLDDGHWGEFQLRDPRWVRDGQPVSMDAVLTGYGFDASAVEILQMCRGEVDPDDEQGDQDHPFSVDLDLLPLLARPHWDGDRPPTGDVR